MADLNMPNGTTARAVPLPIYAVIQCPACGGNGGLGACGVCKGRRVVRVLVDDAVPILDSVTPMIGGLRSDEDATLGLPELRAPRKRGPR